MRCADASALAPRFPDLGDQRFWRADLPDGTAPAYGPLEAIARNKINRQKIRTQRSDMTRIAGSLVTNQVRAYDLPRRFARNGRPTPLGQAFAEYGRIDETLHLLSILDPIDDTYRRKLNKQLTVQESRHRLARKICHGSNGQIRKAYREGQRLWAWSSTRSCCGTRRIRRPRSTACARTAPRSRTRTPLGCPRSATPTSTSLGRYSISSSTPAEGLRQFSEIPDLPDFPDTGDLEEEGA
ncbi:Tn3 family transposase [Nonomuraea fuscirosea]|uniref:Tn3 family transposase n=1 Tax=Nonomuraea fuscirosea TaxID=1291556 RepID=UPI003F4D9DEB